MPLGSKRFLEGGSCACTYTHTREREGGRDVGDREAGGKRGGIVKLSTLVWAYQDDLDEFHPVCVCVCVYVCVCVRAIVCIYTQMSQRAVNRHCEL